MVSVHKILILWDSYNNMINGILIRYSLGRPWGNSLLVQATNLCQMNLANHLKPARSPPPESTKQGFSCWRVWMNTSVLLSYDMKNALFDNSHIFVSLQCTVSSPEDTAYYHTPFGRSLTTFGVINCHIWRAITWLYGFSRSNLEKVVSQEWDSRLTWNERDVSR